MQCRPARAILFIGSRPLATQRGWLFYIDYLLIAHLAALDRPQRDEMQGCGPAPWRMGTVEALKLAPLQRTTTVDLQHATDNMGRATDSMRQITDNVHRAIDNNNAATDSGPHATDNLQRTRRNMQQTTEQKTLQPPTCNNATDHGSQKTENMQNCDRQQTACNMHETTDNKRNMHHTTCNMQRAKDNRQRTTVVNMIRYAIDNKQHTTSSDRQLVTMQQTYHDAEVT